MGLVWELKPRMSIRLKVLLIICIALIAFFAVAAGVLFEVVSTGFGTVEQSIVTEDAQRVEKALQAEVDELLVIAYDFGVWDATYQYIRTYANQSQ